MNMYDTYYDFHKAMEARLDRPVFTHEFAHPDLLLAEANEKCKYPLSQRAALGVIMLLSLGLWAAIWLAVSGIIRVVFG
jgi:hypothetical protein